MTHPFLRFYQPAPEATRLLICLPHAGGGASAFRAWPPLFDARIDVAVVQYPGREDRFIETAIDNMPQLVTSLTEAIFPLVSQRDYALLGHSMGGAIAHEVAMSLSEQGATPQRLFVSGRQPPRFHPTDSTIHRGSDADILAELCRLNPDNRALVASPELAALLVPIIRNDYRLIENYRPIRALTLSCPIDVLTGRDDPDLPAYQAQAWAEYTSAPCQVHVFPGDHFFITSQRRAVIETVTRTLCSDVFPTTEG